MNDRSTGAVEAAREYEEALVPALMAEWAPRLIDAASIAPGHHVLDVACGTGVLTRHVADVVRPSGSVVGLDFDAGMLTIARATRPDIQWQEGSANDLPYADATFDAVVSQFGLMFFPDAPRAIAEMWRVLKPGGRMAVAVWASLEETPAYDVETRVIERIGGPATSTPMRLPFSMGQRATFEAQFARAGIPWSR